MGAGIVGTIDGRRSAGIGLRSPHLADLLTTRPAVPWLEVHAENYLTSGPALRALEAVRAMYPVALHGVGLSLGSADGLDRRHLARLRRLVQVVHPLFVSEHLSWSMAGRVYFNHLLPLPYTEEALAVVCRHIDEAQEVLRRQILLENPSSYLAFTCSTIDEPEFLNAVAGRTGCGLLCDVNNVFVSGRNLGFDALAYVETLDGVAVQEFHLAGHTANEADGRTILIDDHGSRVAPEVWRLFAHAVARWGGRPTLVEWDTDLPALDVLLDEAALAERVLLHAGREVPCAIPS
jgi:uncharacterized protein (UPF0276 family)